MKYPLGEFLGTFVLIFIGTGSCFLDQFGILISGLPQVALCWALAVALGIVSARRFSDAHINPAVTIAMSATGRYPWRKVPLTILAQFAGAILASFSLYSFFFHGRLAEYESLHGIVRGDIGSELSARSFGEYFPNPGMFSGSDRADFISMPMAMFYEFIGTAALLFGVFVLTSLKNPRPLVLKLTPLLIGLLVCCLIILISPYTQAGFNPARDLSPKIVACFAGWKSIAIPGPRGGAIEVYVLSPILGALFGSFLYLWIANPTKESK